MTLFFHAIERKVLDMAVYGLQADIEQNKGRNVNLYVPGKTQLSAQDVFLGGPGTGVTDDMIGLATRVFGNDRRGTELALNDYNNDLSSQIKAAIAQNAAPRADANLGMATLARQNMEIDQAQNAIDNPMKAAALTGQFNGAPTLQQKTFDQGVTQDTFSNEYNVGNMMGNYKGSDTMAQRAQNIQQAQFNASLSASAARSSAPKAPTVGQQENNATAMAIEAIQSQAPNMTRSEFNSAMDGIKSTWIRDGADFKVIQDAIDNVVTRDEADASNAEADRIANAKAYNATKKWWEASLPEE